MFFQEGGQWFVCIGVPNGTHLWQVGDASSMNGCFKMGVTKAKEELQTFRFRMMMKPQFRPTDVIPIANKAWACSFARTSRGKKALAERGWNPCNRSILCHKDVLATKTKMDAEQPAAQQPPRSNDLMAELTLASAQVVATTDLNLDEGYVADVVDVLNSGRDNDLARRRSLERKRGSDKSLLDFDKANTARQIRAAST
jgi:hypothetical protein